MEVYITGMENCLNQIDSFYVSNKLKHPWGLMVSET